MIIQFNSFIRLFVRSAVRSAASPHISHFILFSFPPLFTSHDILSKLYTEILYMI